MASMYIAKLSGGPAETNNELKSLKLEYEQTLQQIKLENPEYLSIISVNPMTLKDIQLLLDNDTAIVEYFLADEKVYVWIIDNKKINSFL